VSTSPEAVPPKRRARLADVAAVAGVSKGAVSRVLNGGASPVRISDGTRERILAAARQLDYEPNAAARALGRRRTETIALIIPGATEQEHRGHRFSHLKLSETLSGIDAATAARGYHVLLQIADTDPFEDPRHHRIWKNGAVDGILWIAMPLTPQVNSLRVPVVAINSMPTAEIDAATFNADHYGGARMATRHLIRLGHTAVAHIAAPRDSWAGRERLRGYHDAMAEAGLTPFVSTGDGFEESGVQQMQNVLATSPRTTAIFVGGDLMAVGALRVASLAGVKVPHDLAIVGMDGVKVCLYTTPSLTTVKMHMHALAKRAATSLLDQIESVASAPAHVTAPMELHIRESCGFPTSMPPLSPSVPVTDLDQLEYPPLVST